MRTGRKGQNSKAPQTPAASSAPVVASGPDGQGDLPQGSEPVKLDPAAFTTRIDNLYWPMAPGDKWVYRETNEQGMVQRTEVTVTGRTKRIANVVEARVVHDVVTKDGELVEVTDDWYTQDEAGNVCTWERTPPSTRTAR